MMNENHWEKSFEFSQQFIRQLITLSTAIVALTATFYKTLIGENGSFDRVSLALLICIWTFFLLSTWFGVRTFMSVIGTLDHAKDKTPSIYDRSITSRARPQVIFFFLGLMASIGFGVMFGIGQF